MDWHSWTLHTMQESHTQTIHAALLSTQTFSVLARNRRLSSNTEHLLPKAQTRITITINNSNNNCLFIKITHSAKWHSSQSKWHIICKLLDHQRYQHNKRMLSAAWITIHLTACYLWCTGTLTVKSSQVNAIDGRRLFWASMSVSLMKR